MGKYAWMMLWRASGSGRCARRVNESIDGEILRVVAAAVDPHIPAQLVCRPEEAAKIVQAQAIVVLDLRFPLERLIHVGSVRRRAAVDRHLQRADAQPLVAQPRVDAQLAGAVVQLRLGFLLAETVPARHQVGAHGEFAVVVERLIGADFLGVQPRLDDAGDAEAEHLPAAQAQRLPGFVGGRLRDQPANQALCFGAQESVGLAVRIALDPALVRIGG